MVFLDEIQLGKGFKQPLKNDITDNQSRDSCCMALILLQCSKTSIAKILLSKNGLNFQLTKNKWKGGNFMKQLLTFLCAALMIIAVDTSSATTIVLDFEGVGDSAQVGNFYDAAYGIIFSDNALAFVDQDAGGTGNFGGEPSPDTTMAFLSGTAATMNVASGFDTGFSFFYSSIYSPGFINVYDGLNGTGTILANLNLPITSSDGGDPTGAFSPFYALGVSFSGIAKSVDFGGTINSIGFDNITLGSSTPGGADPVPEPATLALLGLGLLGFAGISRKKFTR